MHLVIRKIIVILLTVSLVALVACESIDNKKSNLIYEKKENIVTDKQYYQNEAVKFPNEIFDTPEFERYEIGDVANVKAYFLSSVGDTQIFAYVGLPKNASKENKVSGIVLVHGGGGTAYYEWVNYWTERGYAAIAMATDGNMPTENSKMNNNINQASIKKTGPINSAFSDINKLVEEQWAYHAIASVIVSNSFLRSLEVVDSEKIAITGISYGGFLTCQAVGYDDRFIAASPIYGSLGQEGTAGNFGKIMKNEKISKLWDSVEVLKASRTPILFLNSNIDEFFTVDATTTSFKASKFANISLKTNFLHGHELGSKHVKEATVFIDNILLKTAGLISFKSQPATDELNFKVIIPNGVKILSVEILYTTEEILDNKTNWIRIEGAVNNETVSASVPGNSKYYYVNIYDDRNCVVSSELVSL